MCEAWTIVTKFLVVKVTKDAEATSIAFTLSITSH